MQRLTCVFLFVAVASVRADDVPPPPLKGLDPVSLIAGKDEQGDAAITATHGRFTYRFANATNKATFLAAPEKYAIQYGGACMKMGPLSGYGSADRWDVYEGRIYLFASEGCRTGFRANPKNFIDTSDDEPTGTDVQRKAGAALMAKAVAATGGEERLKSLKTYQVKTKLTQPLRDGKTFVYHRTFVASTKDRTAAEWESYDDVKYGWVVSPMAAFRTSKAGWETVDKQVHDFMARDVTRKPLLLLIDWVNGRAKAIAAGKADDGTERVAVSVDGATSTLGLDASGRVVSTAYRGRAAAGIADIERLFSDFKAVNGITLTYTVKTKIDGKLSEGGTKAEIESITIDEPIPAGLIAKP